MNAVLLLIEALLPQLGGNAVLVEKIVNALVALYPIIAQEYRDLLPIVKNIIVAVKSDPSTTKDQLDALDVLEAQLDADFDAAAAAAAAEDAAQGGA